MFICKMISAITPIFVWLVINVYVLIFSKFLSPLSGLIAVSYTHLDVYKRQM